MGDKSSWEELDKADWRKVGDGHDGWYFEAVEEYFGHLYGGMTGKIGLRGIRGELTWGAVTA